ncbi:MAG: hypothetical protein ACLTEE_11305 [Anaerobutyricum hallii]
MDYDVSEILGLKWSAIDWENETSTIEHTVERRVKTVSIKEDDTKTTAGSRTLNLFSSAKQSAYVL